MPRKKIPEKTKAKIPRLAKNRCGYCLSHQDYVWDILEIDHIFPLAKGGKDDEQNLWLIYSTCNNSKYNKTEAFDAITKQNITLFNPRLQNWYEHFKNNRQNANRQSNRYGFESKSGKIYQSPQKLVFSRLASAERLRRFGRKGVPKEDIVLAFYSPEKRKLTEFAMA